MNSTFYIFGKFNGSYAQFPVDYTQDIFQQLPNRSSFSNTQLVIHRDGNLMYYCYMRKLEQDNFIGFCLLLNDAMIEEIPALFDLFDNGISHLALSGEIVKINDNGDIVSNTDSLLSNRQTIKRLSFSMARDLNKMEDVKKKLPPLSYSNSAGEVKRFSFDYDQSTLLKSSYTFAYTYITKDDDLENLDSYRGTIKRLNSQKQELSEANTTLKEQVKKLTRQKKQQNMVLMLCGVVAACLCFVFFLQKRINQTATDLLTEKNNHQSTQQLLDSTKQDLEEERVSYTSSLANKNKTINQLNSTNTDLKESVVDLENRLEQVTNQLYSYRNELQKAKDLSDQYKKERDDYALQNKTLTEQLNQSKVANQSSVTNIHNANKDGIAEARITRKTTMYLDRSSGKKVLTLKEGKTVQVFVNDYAQKYYRAKYGKTVGYVHEDVLKFTN